VQAIDLRLTGHRADDRLLVGRLAPVAPARAVQAGTVVHLVNSIAFAAVFRLLVRDMLRGPMWLRGATFALVETLVLYPLALFEDFHPAIRDGSMDSYQSPTAFAQSVSRHLALGVVLGALTPGRER
jgi:hypothetical protein